MKADSRQPSFYPKRMRHRGSVTGVILVLLGPALLGGCSANPAKLAAENDRLRAELLDLRKQVDGLRRRNTELQADLGRFSADPEALPPEIRANTPHVAEITIGRLSHVRDEDDDGRPDTLVVYVKPVDGLGRAVQLVGHLSVNAALLPADADAITIGRVQLDPAELRRAYRSAIMGAAHYTVTLPIDLPAGAKEDKCLVRVSYDDGRTRLRHTDEKGVSLRVH